MFDVNFVPEETHRFYNPDVFCVCIREVYYTLVFQTD